MTDIIILAFGFIYLIGALIWIRYWMKQAEEYEKEHPFGSGEYDVFADPGAYSVLAMIFPIALIVMGIERIFNRR